MTKNNIKSRLRIAINRCNYAYKLYCKEKKYYQAKRIYKANKNLYKLLEEYLYMNSENIEETTNFIFHLEDWFEQFIDHEKELESILSLNSEFIFKRFNKSPAFPNNFLKNIE